MGELQINNPQKNRPMMNRSPPPGGYQSFSRGLPCGSSLEVVALGRAITPFRVTAKSDPPACLPKEAGQPVSPKGDWPGWELPLSVLLPKEYSVKGDSEESRSRGRLTDRAFPKIRSTRKIYHKNTGHQAGVVLSYTPDFHRLFTIGGTSFFKARGH